MEIVVVICNVPDIVLARQIATILVAEQLAACVNILAPCQSVYRWEGQVTSAEEIPLLIKTPLHAYARLEQRLQQLHPYDVPEIMALPVSCGLPAYLTWVGEEVLSSS